MIAAAANVCSSQVYAVLVNPLKGYPPAQTWCSAHYPVAPVTTTTTVRSVSTAHTTTTVHTTATHTDVVMSTTYTSTSTVTTQCGNQKFKRVPATKTPTGTAASLSKLQSQAASYVKTVCSCIETPGTTTVTSTVGAKTTVTDTSVVTDTVKTTSTKVESDVTTSTTCTSLPHCAQTTANLATRSRVEAEAIVIASKEPLGPLGAPMMPDVAIARKTRNALIKQLDFARLVHVVPLGHAFILPGFVRIR